MVVIEASCIWFIAMPIFQDISIRGGAIESNLYFYRCVGIQLFGEVTLSKTGDCKSSRGKTDHVEQCGHCALKVGGLEIRVYGEEETC